MPNSVLASAFSDVTVHFPRDVFALVHWMLARDSERGQLLGVERPTTVAEVVEAVAFMTATDEEEIAGRFAAAGIDLEGLVEADPEDSPILQSILHEDGDGDEDDWDGDNDEFLGGGADDGDGEADILPLPGRRGGKRPKGIGFELASNDRKLVLKHGKPPGGMLALLDQNARNKKSIVVECDTDTFRELVLHLTAAAVKMKGPKYDELTGLIGYLLSEAEAQGLDLTP